MFALLDHWVNYKRFLNNKNIFSKIKIYVLDNML